MKSQVLNIKDKERELKEWGMKRITLQEQLASDHMQLHDTVQKMKSEVETIQAMKQEIENHLYIEHELRKRASYLASVVLNPIRPAEWAGGTYMVPEEVISEED